MGVMIIDEIVQRLDPLELSGSVLAVPVVNGFGLIQGSRYLPDRRDLNRCFPGSQRGSLGSRLAHLLSRLVISRCDLGIDFHSGSNGRRNLPHLRCDLDHDKTRRLALAFGAPVGVVAEIVDPALGSRSEVKSMRAGLAIGAVVDSLVTAGDALIHLAKKEGRSG